MTRPTSATRPGDRRPRSGRQPRARRPSARPPPGTWRRCWDIGMGRSRAAGPSASKVCKWNGSSNAAIARRARISAIASSAAASAPMTSAFGRARHRARRAQQIGGRRVQEHPARAPQRELQAPARAGRAPAPPRANSTSAKHGDRAVGGRGARRGAPASAIARAPDRRPTTRPMQRAPDRETARRSRAAADPSRASGSSISNGSTTASSQQRRASGRPQSLDRLDTTNDPHGAKYTHGNGGHPTDPGCIFAPAIEKFRRKPAGLNPSLPAPLSRARSSDMRGRRRLPCSPTVLFAMRWCWAASGFIGAPLVRALVAAAFARAASSIAARLRSLEARIRSTARSIGFAGERSSAIPPTSSFTSPASRAGAASTAPRSAHATGWPAPACLGGSRVVRGLRCWSMSAEPWRTALTARWR